MQFNIVINVLQKYIYSILYSTLFYAGPDFRRHSSTYRSCTCLCCSWPSWFKLLVLVPCYLWRFCFEVLLVSTVHLLSVLCACRQETGRGGAGRTNRASAAAQQSINCFTTVQLKGLSFWPFVFGRHWCCCFSVSTSFLSSAFWSPPHNS